MCLPQISDLMYYHPIRTQPVFSCSYDNLFAHSYISSSLVQQLVTLLMWGFLDKLLCPSFLNFLLLLKLISSLEFKEILNNFFYNFVLSFFFFLFFLINNFVFSFQVSFWINNFTVFYSSSYQHGYHIGLEGKSQSTWVSDMFWMILALCYEIMSHFWHHIWGYI